MKKVISFLIFLFIINLANAQPPFEWVAAYGGSNSDGISSITTDNNGNVYVLGEFTLTVDFDPGIGVINITSNGFFDSFIQKLDSNGNLIWIKAIGGVSHVQGSEIVIDSLENIYISGRFQGTADFDPGASNTSTNSAGSYDAFILKLDFNGDFVWVKTIAATATLTGESLDIDSVGNLYITGRYNGTVDFDPGASVFNITSTNGGLNGNCYLLKLSNNGSFIWAKSFGGSNGGGFGTKLITDEYGFVFAGGNFSGTVDFDPGPGVANHASNGLSDNYIVKIDSSGSFVWASIYGGTGSEYLYGMTEDVYGNIYACGFFQGTTDFDSGPGINNVTSNGADDIFLIKLDNMGSHVWAHGFGGSSIDYGHDITSDLYGNIYLTGWYQFTADFNPDTPVINLTVQGSSDGFLLKLDNNGRFIFAESIGGTDLDKGGAIAVNNQNELFVAGIYSDNVDFDAGIGVAQSTAVGWADSFIIKYDQCIPADTSITVSPNTLTANAVGATFQWLDCGTMDTIPGATNNSYIVTTDGSYAAIITQNGCTDTSACINMVVVAVANANSISKFTIYPNPTLDKVTISFGKVLDKGVITIKNSIGQVMRTEKVSSKKEVELKFDIPSGIYFVEVASDSGNTLVMQKLIVE